MRSWLGMSIAPSTPEADLPNRMPPPIARLSVMPVVAGESLISEPSGSNM